MVSNLAMRLLTPTFVNVRFRSWHPSRPMLAMSAKLPVLASDPRWQRLP